MPKLDTSSVLYSLVCNLATQIQNGWSLLVMLHYTFCHVPLADIKHCPVFLSLGIAKVNIVLLNVRFVAL